MHNLIPILRSSESGCGGKISFTCLRLGRGAGFLKQNTPLNRCSPPIYFAGNDITRGGAHVAHVLIADEILRSNVTKKNLKSHYAELVRVNTSARVMKLGYI